LITAVVPVRIAPDTETNKALEQAVQSALNQTGHPIDVIVIDDGGADSVIGGLDVERVHVLPGPRRGAGAARNVGLQQARTDWVAFLDADDTWLDGYVDRLHQAIEEDPDAGACFGAATHVSDGGQILNRATVRPADATLHGLLTRRLQPTTSATAVNRHVALEVGGFDENFRRPAGVEDIDLWWRIAAARTCIVQPLPLVRYVVHERRDRQRTYEELRQLGADRRRCIARLRGEVPATLFRRAAAQHLAIMARYWLVAGYAIEARNEALASFRYAPTLNGLAALSMALVPTGARDPLRSLRRASIRAIRRP
jgi:glycosyltransferase involved in cell wall biosynthesis